MVLVPLCRQGVSRLALGGCLLASALPACGAAVGDSIKTRNGTVELHAAGGSTTLVYRGKTIVSLGADSAALYRITPKLEQRDFVLVQIWRAGLNCRHAYQLIALSKGLPQVSAPFGHCRDMAGAGFIGGEPVVHLRQSGTAAAPLVTSYLLKRGQISEVFSSANPCRYSDFIARHSVDNTGAMRRDERHVIGSAPLLLSSGPSEGCAQKDAVVSPGDVLTLTFEMDQFRLARYTDAQTGQQIEGWVPSNRVERKP